LPRDLADVLHYFIPETERESERGAAGAPTLDSAHSDLAARCRTSTDRYAHEAAPPPLPILGLPIGERDVVRAALAWNLAIETARLGGASVVVAPALDDGSPLWPEAGIGPLGTELVFCPAHDLESLYHAATDLAVSRAETAPRGGIVFVRIPPSWLDGDGTKLNPIRWMLLLTSANRRDLHEAFELTRALLRANPRAEVGVTIHGVSAIAEARQAYDHLSRITEERLGLALASYGLLVDDLHVYRAIAAQRPIGLAHPQAPATRALMDVAHLLYEDARSRVLG
jgi:hypothetical protein